MSPVCSFCKKGRDERKVIIVAAEGAICDRCAQEAAMVLGSFESDDDDPEPEPPGPSAKVINFAEAIARRAEAA